VWKSVQQSGRGRMKLLVENLIINRVLHLVSSVILTSWFHTETDKLSTAAHPDYEGQGQGDCQLKLTLPSCMM
jgi:hypothetical protein